MIYGTEMEKPERQDNYVHTYAFPIAFAAEICAGPVCRKQKAERAITTSHWKLRNHKTQNKWLLLHSQYLCRVIPPNNTGKHMCVHTRWTPSCENWMGWKHFHPNLWADFGWIELMCDVVVCSTWNVYLAGYDQRVDMHSWKTAIICIKGKNTKICTKCARKNSIKIRILQNLHF